MRKHHQFTDSEKLLLRNFKGLLAQREQLNPMLQAKVTILERKLNRIKKQREKDLKYN